MREPCPLNSQINPTNLKDFDLLVAITRCALRHARTESKICQPWPQTQMFTQLKDAAMQAVHAFLYTMSIQLVQCFPILVLRRPLPCMS